MSRLNDAFSENMIFNFKMQTCCDCETNEILKNENFYEVFFAMTLWSPNQIDSSKFFRLTFWVHVMNILKSSIRTFHLTKSKTQDFHFVWKMWRNGHSFTFFDNAWSLTLKNTFIQCPYKQVHRKSVVDHRESSLLTWFFFLWKLWP